MLLLLVQQLPEVGRRQERHQVIAKQLHLGIRIGTGADDLDLNARFLKNRTNGMRAGFRDFDQRGDSFGRRNFVIKLDPSLVRRDVPGGDKHAALAARRSTGVSDGSRAGYDGIVKHGLAVFRLRLNRMSKAYTECALSILQPCKVNYRTTYLVFPTRRWKAICAILNHLLASVGKLNGGTYNAGPPVRGSASRLYSWRVALQGNL